MTSYIIYVLASVGCSFLFYFTMKFIINVGKHYEYLKDFAKDDKLWYMRNEISTLNFQVRELNRVVDDMLKIGKKA